MNAATIIYCAVQLSSSQDCIFYHIDFTTQNHYNGLFYVHQSNSGSFDLNKWWPIDEIITDIEILALLSTTFHQELRKNH